jgi:hypothetical protein
MRVTRLLAEHQGTMKLWRRQKGAEQSAAPELAELDFAELRTPVPWCRSCRRSQPPYVYFENGKHYCVTCASTVRWNLGVPIAGRRNDDIREVPLPAS